MIGDVRVQRADRHVLRVRLAVGLDFVGLAARQLSGALEVGRSTIELSNGQIRCPRCR